MTTTPEPAPQDEAPGLPEEVLTRAVAEDVALPGGGGTLALVTLDNGRGRSRPNTFGPASLASLHEVLAGLRERAEAGEVTAVALTGPPHEFAVGADLGGVPSIRTREQALGLARAGHRVVAALMDLPVATFAFLGGATLGGGLELALACDHRTVAGDVRQVALPETSLGLVPGWGGCHLLPALVGPEAAVRVIVENPLANSTMLTAAQAHALGIADALLDPADFLEESLAWAARVLAGSEDVTRVEAPRDEQAWQAALERAGRVVAARTAGCSPAPLRAVELLRGARAATREEAFAAEDEALADLLMGEECRAGLYAFDLLQRRARRPVGAPDPGLARRVAEVGVVGAGLMASQLALLFARRLEVPVVLTDLDQERVDRGLAWVRAEVTGLAEQGRLDPDTAHRVAGLVTGSTDTSAYADADLVIEAVFEEIAVKKAVFAEVERVVRPDCVLASNTSSLSVGEMAADLDHPERVVGLHFFNPVAVMPLVEVVRAGRTDDATLATAVEAARTLRKTAVLVGDSPSFVVNRLLGRYMGEFARIVEAGTPVEVADAAVAGLAPMPPLVLVGLVGPAIALHNSETLHAAFGDRFPVSQNLRRIVEAGRPGYYRTVDGRRELDPEVAALLVTPQDPIALDAGQVRTAVLDALADEVRRMLDEEVVASPEDVDLALITGAGFATWNGGLTPLLDRQGASERAAGGRFLPRGVASVPR